MTIILKPTVLYIQLPPAERFAFFLQENCHIRVLWRIFAIVSIVQSRYYRR